VRPFSGPAPRRALLIAAMVAAGAVLVAATALIVIVARGGGGPTPPHPSMALLVASDTAAAAAADAEAEGSATQKAAASLAGMPTAVWLTPEDSGVGEVGARVDELLSEAEAADAAVTLVVYGLPERDCGQFSAGGLPPEDYPEWTAEIGAALEAAPDVPAIVILEPDSLALAPECGNVDDRVAQLRAAIDDLVAANTWVYLDAGHSNWLPVDQMADLLSQAGVERVRGFATNVSNYYDLAAETAYAHALSKALGGAHAVIDTSRNGAGSNGEWCNPSGRLIGEEGATTGDDVVDLNLWIKPPGESDGTCNGGPAAGEWWPQAAIELTRASRD
jgi:endoglucanase